MVLTAAVVLVAVAHIMPASAEILEIRGEVVELTTTQSAPITWNAYNFGAFWYDLDDNLATETLTIAAITLIGPDTDRTIDENCLSYQTGPAYQQYELYENEGLTVDGDTGYYLEGFMGGRYVAINGRADKLTKLLVEFEDYDKKTMATEEPWDLGSGFALTSNQIIGKDIVEFTLSKNGLELDNKNVSVGEVYTYTTYLAGEYDVPVFSCYVDAVFNGIDIDIVQLQYVFLIDDEVMKINTGETHGAMEVVTASSSQVVLRNDETIIDLDEGWMSCIMGDMYFKTADDKSAIRFYPMVEHYTLSDVDSDGDSVPDEWDEEPDTPAGYWTDSDGRGRMLGDMNGDGELTSVDALMILQAAAGKIKW